MTALDVQSFFPFAVAGIFLLGLAFGSFLNVCIYRLPRHRSVVSPRSACPHCGAPIAAYDNIPVVSWLLLRGRCRRCRAPISARYLFVEVFVAALFALIFLRLGYSPATLKYCVFAFLVTGLIFTDLDCKLLPDTLTLPGLAMAVGFAALVPVEPESAWLPFSLWQRIPLDLAWRAQSLADCLLGAALGALLIYGAGWIYLKARGVEGMGFGDVKLMAMVGGFLGMELVVFTIGAAALAASLFGLAVMLAVWRKRLRRRMARGHENLRPAMRRAWASARLLYRHYEIPFGSFLGAMALVAFFYGHALVRWYMRLWSLG